VYELAFAQHTSALEIDLEIAHPDDGFRSSLWRRDVTHGDANACQQLLQSNWLGEVIVSSHLEHGDFVTLRFTCRQDENRQAGARANFMNERRRGFPIVIHIQHDEIWTKAQVRGVRL